MNTPSNKIESKQQTIWNRLVSEGIVFGQLPELSSEYKHWYIKVIQGVGGWLAGCFLLGFIALSFGWIFHHENTWMIFSLSIAAIGATWLLVKEKHSTEFVQQLSLMFNLCGQLLFVWGLFELLERWNAVFFLLLCLYQVAIIYFINNYLSRFLTTWFASFSLFALFARMGFPDLNLLIAALLFVGIWYFDNRWKQSKDFWEPIGYGIAFALVQINGQTFGGDVFDWWYKASQYPWLDSTIYWITQFGIAGILGGLCLELAKKYQFSLQSKNGLQLAIGFFILAILGYVIPGTTASLLLLLIGFMRQRIILFALGIVSIIGFVSWYYYLLDITLLEKSVILVTFGTCFLICFAIVNQLNKQKVSSMEKAVEKKQQGKPASLFSDWRLFVPVIVSILLLLGVNWDIYKKERILSEGRIVLLQLAPVDPRSLMQGDYMRLRFAIERSLINEKHSEKKRAGVESFVVTLDDNNVGRLAINPSVDALNDNQVTMQFRIRNGQIRLATHAFFFQEGTGEIYENAEYGEFRVADNGELLLNALRDEKFAVLGKNRPSN